MKVTIEIDMTAERAQRAVGMMREVKRFYEETADARMRQGKLTLVQAAQKLEPIADALLIVGAVELAITEASEPGLDEVAEYEALAGDVQSGNAVTLPKAALKSVAKENEAACGDCRVPRCRFCDQPGTRAGGRKDGAGRTVERYYVCETAGCIASKMKTPQPAQLFSGGN